MGPGSFLFWLLITATIALIIAVCAAVIIVYLLPKPFAYITRIALEWAVSLSGAGFVVLFISWRLIMHPHGLPYVAPGYLGAAIAISYLPLCTILFIQALEPHRTVIPTARSLGFSILSTLLAVLRCAQPDFVNAFGLFVARLLADAAAFTLIMTGLSRALWSVFVIIAMALVFARHLCLLAQRSSLPVNLPLFAPLHSAPSQFNWRWRLDGVRQVALLATLVLAFCCAVYKLCDLSLVRIIADNADNFSQATNSDRVYAVRAAIRAVLPILIVVTMGTGIWLLWRSSQPIASKIPVLLAGLSPILTAYPAVANLSGPWYLWLPLAIGGLCVYIIIQDAATCHLGSITALHSLIPGQSSTACAVRALNRPLICYAGLQPTIGQALSATAVWLASAALLAVVLDLPMLWAAAHALVWVLLAGLMQLAALWVRQIELRMQPPFEVLSIGQEVK